MYRFFLLIFVGFYALPVIATDLPRNDPVPGGIAIVPLFSAHRPAPAVYFQGARTMVAKQRKRWHAIVGLALPLKAGKYYVTTRDPDGSQIRIPFRVKKKSYRSQHLRIKDKRKVEPSDEDLVRIIRENREIKSLFTIWSDFSPVTNLDLPVNGRLSSRFGLRRYFNNKPRKPHSGIDIAAPQGTAVNAPARAIVIGVGDYFFTGNAVFLDHGQGLITMYNHLHKVSVSIGDTVERGQKIGEVGKTGRVTGPHLHWSVSLNNSRVNPDLFTTKAARVAGKDSR